MTTYTPLTDATLKLDEPCTEAVGRAGMRDNLLAVTEGDASAPRVVTKAINSAYFQAKRTTDQTVTNTAITRVQMNSEDYDPDSLYDNATNYRFIPNKAGLY